MPESNFPRVTMADEDLRSLLYGSDKTPPSRKWSCPEDETIAAYADGALRGPRKTWLEFHLAGCGRCRLLVAEVIKAQRELDLPSPPEDVRWKAISLVEHKSPSEAWVWAPAGALAVVALLAAIIVFRTPEQLNVEPPSPSAPLIAKSELAAPLQTPVRDVERKSRSADLVPSVILPQADSVVVRGQLDIGWKPVPTTRYYEVRLVTSDGDLVWEGQTEKTELQAPSKLALRDGFYFVWITAYLADGRIARSSPVKIRVNRN